MTTCGHSQTARVLGIVLCIVAAWAWRCPAAESEAIEAWRDLKFGLFVHWGPVSLKGTEIGWSRGREVPADEYDQLYKRFNPTLFDAQAWVTTAKEAGMRYLVLTSKHHDGFCLWPSKYTDYHIGNTPFQRDVMRELAAACAEHGIQFCTYHSICDWYHPDYPMGSPGGSTKKPSPNMPRYFQYLKNQTREIIENYGPLGIMWFDGQWEEPWTLEYGDELYAYLKGLQPNLVINNRVSKGRNGIAGDYDTPEQRIGNFQNNRPWETCMTICQQWAWKPNDVMKSEKECIQTLVRVVGGDGNLLFNVGPMPDGRIEPRQVDRLLEMGQWLGKYGQTIYGTRGGPFKTTASLASTYRGNTVYVHILDWRDETVTLPALPKRIANASLLTGGSVSVRQTSDAIVIGVREEHRDPIDTIVELTLDGPAADIAPLALPSSSLAAGKKASASNIFQNNPSHGPDKAFDDDPGTRWATDSGVKQAWLEVDLGRPETIAKVMLSEAYDRVRRFELQYADDGTWVTFVEGRRIGEEFTAGFEPVTSQRIRLNILEATDGPTIWEFQLLAPRKTP
ncbi:MAG: alpha-L-fucosidase [Sedimentisphaerales bacterium]|nr:alpha-L-fucosidase [Sedimentisphaerales bacterium]HNY79788.1 alpha-L-fucosidase [Sedimentisphaerales bacterium]HOC62234.1 alpha-L-fucosidase [Sedimentisphaerales bacterium]HOH63125.1 alpha-L-fucosidase [Sedimentisphaerales bacterium]HPY51790.1 alpha-L-fucosidase [Sedimentisphaerales bacterium]